MAVAKKTGFFWGEGQFTLVGFDKTSPVRIVSSPLQTKTDTASPFSSEFTEEMQIITALQKTLQESGITDGTFQVSLPMREVILRSFEIPSVNKDNLAMAVKFEAKKYLPIDINDLIYIFHQALFVDANKNKRLQIIFFAIRREIIDRYERVLRQANVSVSLCEPCVVSLTKVLLSNNVIKPVDHVAYLILYANVGHIFFIYNGVPQFFREFSFFASEETRNSAEALNLKIVSEVGNSFDFYARQFGREQVGQMLVSAKSEEEGLLGALQTELKLTIKKVSPLASMGGEVGRANDMDAVYATGSCLTVPSVAALSKFNFLEQKAVRPKADVAFADVSTYKNVLIVFLLCLGLLTGFYFFFQLRLKIAQQEYVRLSSKEGAYTNVPVTGIQGEITDNINQLAAYKGIRTKSDITDIVLLVASHLPEGAVLKELSVNYHRSNANNAAANDSPLVIEMNGEVFRDDPSEEIAVVKNIFSNFKKDKKMLQYVKNVELVSLNFQTDQDDKKQVTMFTIRCS